LSTTHRFGPLILGLFLVSSGCLSGLGSGSGDAMTAQSLLGRAEELAAMDHGANLMAVFTLETASGASLAERSPPAWLQPFLNVTDDAVGDGRSSVWGYYFGSSTMAGGMAAEGEAGHSHDGMGDLLVIVGEGKKELFRGAVPMDFPVRPSMPLGTNWTIDSDLAASNARDADWSALMAAPGAYSFASLAVRIGSPAAWLFEAGTVDTEEGLAVAADARDGLKINLGNRDPFAPVKTEEGELTGSATPSGSKSTFAIEFPAHRQIEFFLEIAEGGGGVTQSGAQLEFVAKGPGGQAFPFHWDGSGGTNQAWHQFDAPNPGSWTLEAKLIADQTTRETSQAFAVKWCALGASRC
jgi:hypothetical protein